MLPPAGLPGYATAKNPFSQTSKLRSRFLPVILLVGAFDPLDEQEAQRVGADGVLKKPFVPPDPLISMVKSALLRAGAAHGNASAAKTPEPEALKASDLLRPSGLAVPTLAGILVPTGPPEPVM